MIKPNFTSIFASLPVRCVIGDEKDKYLSLASLASLKPFIPYVDPKNVDLLPIAFDSCIINVSNLNGDIIDTETALSIYKTFEKKQCNTEHNRHHVVGVILTASLSEYGTNRLLTEDDVRGKDIPFYITLGGVLWRTVNEELCDLIEDSNIPSSENYLNFSASWELYFSSFLIIEMEQGKKNLSDGTIISNPEQIESLKKYLKCFGGSGVKDGKCYYRMPNENVIAAGIGLTEKPAADVKGIAVNIDEPEKVITPATAPAVASAEIIAENVEIISQPQILCVKKEEYIMKLNSITDITDENLKQCNASVITDFIKSELTKASEGFVLEKQQQAEANEKLKASIGPLTKTVEEMQATIADFKKAQEARAALDTFNARMSEVHASYTLPDEVAKFVADDLKACATEEAFASWKAKAAILLKPYSKASDMGDDEAQAKKKAADKEKADKDAADKKAADDKAATDAKAKEAIASVVEDAIDNAKKEAGGLPNSSASAAKGLKEKYATAFAMTVDGRDVKVD